MRNIDMYRNITKLLVGTVVLLAASVFVLGYKLNDANRKAEASGALLDRVFEDHFKYYCDTLSNTEEYEAYYKAYRIGDIVIE